VRCFYGKWTEALYSCDVDAWESNCRSSWRESEKSNDDDIEVCNQFNRVQLATSGEYACMRVC